MTYILCWSTALGKQKSKLQPAYGQLQVRCCVILNLRSHTSQQGTRLCCALPYSNINAICAILCVGREDTGGKVQVSLYIQSPMNTLLLEQYQSQIQYSLLQVNNDPDHRNDMLEIKYYYELGKLSLKAMCRCNNHRCDIYRHPCYTLMYMLLECHTRTPFPFSPQYPQFPVGTERE